MFRLLQVTREESREWLQERSFVLSGLIGVGKTTFCKELEKEDGLHIYYEPAAENPYLSSFYEDKSRYAFNAQIFFIAQRIYQYKVLGAKKKGIVHDRVLFEDKVFATMLRDQGMMTEVDFQTYEKLYEAVVHEVEMPDVVIFLDATPQECLDRIKKRNLGKEVTGITLEYLTDLRNHYKDYIEDISKVIPVFVVDWTSFKSAHDIMCAVYLMVTKASVKRGIHAIADCRPSHWTDEWMRKWRTVPEEITLISPERRPSKESASHPEPSTNMKPRLDDPSTDNNNHEVHHIQCDSSVASRCETVIVA